MRRLATAGSVQPRRARCLACDNSPLVPPPPLLAGVALMAASLEIEAQECVRLRLCLCMPQQTKDTKPRVLVEPSSLGFFACDRALPVARPPPHSVIKVILQFCRENNLTQSFQAISAECQARLSAS